MTAYAEIDPATGRVLQQRGRADPPDFVGPADPAPADGPNEWRQLDQDIDWHARPSETHVLQWPIADPAPGWVDTATLDELKAAKNAEINAARLKANRTSFQYAGKAIACDELSMIDIQSANGAVALTGALPGGWPGAWKAMDNTYVSISDVATWTAFYQAMVDTGTANFNHSQDLKAQLAAATTPEQVAAIVW